MYVERLKIQNFRNIRETEFALNYPGKENGASALPNVNLFLGDNGSGKTSVFKALILAVRSKEFAFSGFRSDFLVRRAPTSGDKSETRLESTVLYYWPNHQKVWREVNLTTIKIGRENDLIKNDLIESDENNNSAQSLLGTEYGLMMAYGANRRAERPEAYSDTSRTLQYQRVASLFEEYVGLVPFNFGMFQLESYGYFEEARELLNNLLPVPIQLSLEYDPRTSRPFDCKGTYLPYSSLSDGFRVFISWIWDMLLQLAHNANPRERLVDQRGIVIVDEIDLLLHPEWQRVVIPKVAKAFPNIQFCFSTHSPIVAGTVEKENLYVMETEPDGSATVRQYRDDIHGLTPNQILTSPYFGLASVRAPGTGTLADLAKQTANGNGSAEPRPLTPDPAFNQWLTGVLEKEVGSAEKPKRARRKKTPQD